MVSEAITQGAVGRPTSWSPRSIDAIRALATAPNQKVVIVPIEAAGLAGTLGGIAELTKSVFGGDGAAPARLPKRTPSDERIGSVMIVEWIIGLDAWAWIILGVVLIGLELAPGVFLLWLGLAAVATGLVDGMAACPGRLRHCSSRPLSVVAVLVGRALSRPDVSRETSSLNRAARPRRTDFRARGADHRGEGRIRVDDSSWRVTGPDQPAGAGVRVVRVEARP